MRRRAVLLDEGLEVLTGLWRGEPLSLEGAHHRVKARAFLPRPLQQPRIPIWLAGYWPHRAPFRRAARYDGVFPLFGRGHEPGAGDEVAQLAACVEFIEQERGTLQDFDVVYLAKPTRGMARQEAAARTAPFGRAGATWWLERLTPDEFGGRFESDWPVDAMREHVRGGPPSF